MRRRRDQNQNFDSLLDTMANVVGILVVVMAFTQIHVGEAVRRIHQVETAPGAAVSPEARAGAIREGDRLESDLETFAPSSLAAVGELERMQERFLHHANFQAADAKDLISAQQVVVALLREDREARERDRSLTNLRAEEQQMQIRLSETRREVESAVHRIRLPDPRPAPLGTEAMTFFCRYGRVKYVDIDELDRLRISGLDSARKAPRYSGSSVLSSLIRHFYQRDIGDDSVRWRLREAANNQIYVKLEFRNREIGEERNTIAAVESHFRQSLYAASPNQRYILFEVWSDSFSVYLRARSIAEEMGYSVGWIMRDRHDEFGGFLGFGAPPGNPIPID